MKLFDYWRSGTAYRVRLAAAFKGIEMELVPVNLAAGEQLSAAYKADNPSAAVPLLVLEDGTRIGQSGAILEYLDERFPDPPLLPPSAKERARVRHLCQIIGCDIHPVQNLRIQKYLRSELSQPQSEIDAWLQRWMGDGLAALEDELSRDQRRAAFCHGGAVSMAECYLLPQLYSARRFGVALENYPNILEIEKAVSDLPFAQAAHPDAQPGAS